MRCEICGRKLTDAAIALGYCPSCGSAIATTVIEHAQRKIQLSIHEDSPSTINTINTQGEIEAILLQPATVTQEAVVHNAEGGIVQQVNDRLPAVATERPPVVPEVMPVNVTTTQHSNILISVLLALIAILVIAIVGLVVTGSVRINGFISPFASTTHASVIATSTLSPTNTVISAPTPTPLPSVPPAPDGYTSFISLDRQFGFNIPVPWTANKPLQIGSATTYSITSPSGSQFSQITQTPTSIVPANISSYLANFVQSSQGANFQATGSAVTFTSGKNTWIRLECTYTINGLSQNCVGLALNYHDQGFIFIYSADPPDYSTLPGSPFAEMIGSFTFLS